MRIQLTRHLACIKHYGRSRNLSLDLLDSTNGNECLEGFLKCEDCNQLYPVINGVALLLEDIQKLIMGIEQAEWGLEQMVQSANNSGDSRWAKSLEQALAANDKVRYELISALQGIKGRLDLVQRTIDQVVASGGD